MSERHAELFSPYDAHDIFFVSKRSTKDDMFVGKIEHVIAHHTEEVSRHCYDQLNLAGLGGKRTGGILCFGSDGCVKPV